MANLFSALFRGGTHRATATIHQSSAAVVEPLEQRRLFAITITPHDPSGPASDLANALLLPNTGISITGSSYIGESSQGGTYSGFSFTSGDSVLTIQNGVVLTSGNAQRIPGNTNRPDDAGGAQDESTALGTAGDADLDNLTGEDTNDANALTVNFTTSAGINSVLLDFVFGSEEFPDFVGSFNDAFAAYLDGTQITFDINSNPITVNNNFFQLNNSGLSGANFPPVVGKIGVSFDIEYDGLTPHIRTTAPLDASITTHTLKLVIADTGDDILDSGVFITRLQGSTQVVSGPVTDLPQTGVLEFNASTYSVDENAGSISVDVNRVGGTSGLVTVDFAVAPGTATAAADFTGSSGTLTFADGETSKTIVIPILDDTLGEGDETINLTLSNPTGDAPLGASANAIVTILDNELTFDFSQSLFTVNESDKTATITVTRSGASASATSVDFAAGSGSATDQFDFFGKTGSLSFAPGESSKTFTVPLIWDFDAEDTETVNLILRNPAAPGELGPTSSTVLQILDVERPFSLRTAEFAYTGRRLDTLNLTFNQALNGGTAQDLLNYDLYLVKQRRLGGSPSRTRVELSSVSYVPTTTTVVVKTQKPLKLNKVYELNVNSSRETGIRSSDGEPLDGNQSGTADGPDDALFYLARGNKITYFDSEGDKVDLSLRGRGVIELVRDVLRDADTVRLLDASGSTLTGKVGRVSRSTGGTATIDDLIGSTGVNNQLPQPPFIITRIAQ